MNPLRALPARRFWTRHLLSRVLTLGCALALLAPTASAMRRKPPAKPSNILEDGQHVTLTGTLRIERRGWSQYLMLQTRQKYRLHFDTDEARTQAVREIGLRLPWKDALLVQFLGREVTATGTLQLNATSPYYWNGGLLTADSVTLPGGGVQTSGKAPVLPDTLRLYKSTVTLHPGVYTWNRSALDVETNKPIDAKLGMDGCSLNGSGELLNCTCAADFVAVRGGMQDATGLKLHPVQGGLAQFDLDDDARKPVTVQVECARKKEKK